MYDVDLSLAEFLAEFGHDFLFHYTSVGRAESIAEDLVCQSETGAHHGFGFYATDIEPVDQLSIDELNTECFRGERREVELSAALILFPSDATNAFARIDMTREWRIPTDAPLEPIPLDALLAAVARWDGVEWRVFLTQL